MQSGSIEGGGVPRRGRSKRWRRKKGGVLLEIRHSARPAPHSLTSLRAMRGTGHRDNS
uniref:Uncharacterized protein n=1 Tax=Anguilla anguilla TaxID=7936 RepID=A0A0E9R8A4_ANGAN